jgi:putative hydrolase of the HAD superfamily
MINWLSVLQEFPVPAPASTVPGGVVPALEPRPKAVLFDVYGTLVCDQVGDRTEEVRQASNVKSFVATAERFGFSVETGLRWHDWFFEAIVTEHREMEEMDIIPAEVLVDNIWEKMIVRAGGDPRITEPRMLAIYREMLAKPVRAFAGAAEALMKLKGAGLRLGLASNSQFYTMPVLELILGLDPEEIFESELTFLSFQLGFAKHDPHFFRLARTSLLNLGLEAEETLVVGNNCKNDILASRAHGLQAVLFHGNNQSVRWGKEGGQEVEVITNYESLLTAFGL